MILVIAIEGVALVLFLFCQFWNEVVRVAVALTKKGKKKVKKEKKEGAVKDKWCYLGGSDLYGSLINLGVVTEFWGCFEKKQKKTKKKKKGKKTRNQKKKKKKKTTTNKKDKKKKKKKQI